MATEMQNVPRVWWRDLPRSTPDGSLAGEA